MPLFLWVRKEIRAGATKVNPRWVNFWNALTKVVARETLFEKRTFYFCECTYFLTNVLTFLTDVLGRAAPFENSENAICGFPFSVVEIRRPLLNFLGRMEEKRRTRGNVVPRAKAIGHRNADGDHELAGLC